MGLGWSDSGGADSLRNSRFAGRFLEDPGNAIAVNSCPKLFHRLYLLNAQRPQSDIIFVKQLGLPRDHEHCVVDIQEQLSVVRGVAAGRGLTRVPEFR